MLSLTLRSSGEPLDLLCIGAHSDDIEIGCGGTLLRLLAENPGTRVHWVVLSTTEHREREARASAADFLRDAAAADVRVEHFRESYFPYVGADIKDFFETLKSSVRPDVIFTHHRHDEHQDHRTVAQFTWNSFRDHLILEYEIPKYEGDLGSPNLYVPLPAPTAASKVDLLMVTSRRNASACGFNPRRSARHGRARRQCNAPDGYAENVHEEIIRGGRRGDDEDQSEGHRRWGRADRTGTSVAKGDPAAVTEFPPAGSGPPWWPVYPSSAADVAGCGRQVDDSQPVGSSGKRALGTSSVSSVIGDPHWSSVHHGSERTSVRSGSCYLSLFVKALSRLIHAVDAGNVKCQTGLFGTPGRSCPERRAVRLSRALSTVVLVPYVDSIRNVDRSPPTRPRRSGEHCRRCTTC